MVRIFYRPRVLEFDIQQPASGEAIKDNPFGVGKNVVVGLGAAIGDVFAHPIDAYYGLKDGFVSALRT